jgi:hypothetical protein
MKPPDATHEGYYWGIPVWISDVDGDFNVDAKFRPLDYLIPVVSWFDEYTGIVCEWINPDFEWGGFAFSIREIENEKEAH